MDIEPALYSRQDDNPNDQHNSEHPTWYNDNPNEENDSHAKQR